MKEDITLREFKKRLEEGDLVCNLAQMLAYDFLGKNFDLTRKNTYMIITFIKRTENLIEKLNKYNLEIIKKEG